MLMAKMAGMVLLLECGVESVNFLLKDDKANGSSVFSN